LALWHRINLHTKIFQTPRLHRKSKPFHDHVMSFSIHDNKVWFRHYQVIPGTPAKKGNKIPAVETKLTEIGPRFCLTVVRIFEGSFGGPTLYINDKYVSPNTVSQLYLSLLGY